MFFWGTKHMGTNMTNGKNGRNGKWKAGKDYSVTREETMIVLKYKKWFLKDKLKIRKILKNKKQICLKNVVLSNIPQTHLDSSKKKGAYAHEKSEKIDFSGKLLRLTFGAF